MLLYLCQKIKESGFDDCTFFELAYYWKHKKHKDCSLDASIFQHNGHIPYYVVDFVTYLEEKDDGKTTIEPSAQ